MDSSADNHRFIDNNVIVGSLDLCLNKSRLKSIEVKRVLSVCIKPIKGSDKETGIYYKWIPLSDCSPPTQMIVNFDQCVNYIMEAQKYDENILIHGSNNESISAVVATAFLMKKRQITAKEALKTVMQNPTQCQELSPQLIQSLDIWKRTDYLLNGREPTLRRLFIGELMNEISTKVFGKDLFTCDNIHVYFQSVDKFEKTFNRLEERNETSNGHSPVYACVHCKEYLFNEKRIIRNNCSFKCNFVYIEPQIWTAKQAVDKAMKHNDKSYLITGMIYCWKCRNRIGDYDWNTSNVCHCPLHKNLQNYLIYRFSTSIITRFDSMQDFLNSKSEQNMNTESNSDDLTVIYPLIDEQE